jgi:ferredoxin-NADP reductase
MPMFTPTLLSRKEIAEGTVAFHFSKPQGFVVKAGQSVDLTLIEPPETDAEGNTRAFSLTSSPQEPELIIATRMRDTAFKRVLKSMHLGNRVKIDGPMGSFTLHKNASKPAVFLTGGIGITPFFSMAKSAAAEKLPHEIYLFYSNRRPEDAAFMNELAALLQQNPRFHFIATMTEMEKSKRPWRGETGFIRQELLSKSISSLQGPIYYIAGPPAMVTAMRAMLAAAAVDEDDIRTEEFSGY